MPYGLIVLLVLIALFAFSIITPKYLEPWWIKRTARLTEKLKRRAYNDLKWDIIYNANADNREWFASMIRRFYNQFNPGAMAEYTMLHEFLDEAVQSRVEVDFKKELGI